MSAYQADPNNNKKQTPKGRPASAISKATTPPSKVIPTVLVPVLITSDSIGMNYTSGRIAADLWTSGPLYEAIQTIFADGLKR